MSHRAMMGYRTAPFKSSFKDWQVFKSRQTGYDPIGRLMPIRIKCRNKLLETPKPLNVKKEDTLSMKT